MKVDTSVCVWRSARASAREAFTRAAFEALKAIACSPLQRDA
jgi:hypothetical protein